MEKKFSLIVIAILFTAFGIYAYNYPPVKNETESTKTRFVKLSSSNSNAESKPSMLRMSLIEEMVTNYRQNQLLSIENAGNNAVKDDAHSILFDLDTLKKFISDIERGVKETQPTADSKLAIRMYYAAYPSKLSWNKPGYQDLSKLLDNDITKLYERKHTLIMIPVIQTDKGIFADFNPFDKSTYQGFPKRSKGLHLMTSTDTTEIPALNHGQLIPPASIAGEEF